MQNRGAQEGGAILKNLGGSRGEVSEDDIEAREDVAEKSFKETRKSARASEGSYPHSLCWMAPPLIGFLTVWITVLVANSPMLHKGAAALQNGQLRPPNPVKCSLGTCWDQADKFGYPLCSSASGAGGRIRGYPIEQTESICYRSIMINFEMNSFCALGVLLLWGIFTARVFEVLGEAVLKGEVRVPAAGAIAVTLPSWYYCGKVTFVYVNEYFYDILPSQLFFTISESVMLTIMAMHVRKSSRPRLEPLAFVATTSVCHMLQILMDENTGFFNMRNAVSGRNILLLLGDLVMVLSSISIANEVPGGLQRLRDWGPRLAGLLFAELVSFQLFFAGNFSFSISRLLS
mmetsp:Transcript_50169/g.122421  ORF Transcript_50169/g.122421 Transcript_50169/m.122421 type:complete len:346 (+) Transcript_50169:60-1097(+)